MKNNKYTVQNYSTYSAFPFKFGEYKTLAEFKNSPIQTFHFSLKNSTRISVYETWDIGLYSQPFKVWLIYSHDLKSTWLSSRDPAILSWLVPYVENYPTLWENLVQI